ncbi:MAG: hypothetical protein BYD32DRAFT_405695, partial [Podila humilis]
MTNVPTTIVPIGTALPGNTQNFTWTVAMQMNSTPSLIEANYTLRIFDGAIGRIPVGQTLGGYLMTYTGLKFSMYVPGDYTPGDQLTRRFFFWFLIDKRANIPPLPLWSYRFFVCLFIMHMPCNCLTTFFFSFVSFST